MEPAARPHRHPSPETACRLSPDALEAVTADLAPQTRRAYVGRLRAVAAELDGADLTDTTLSGVLADMAAQGRAPSTLAQTVAAVRCAANRLGEPDPVGPQCDRTLRVHRRATGPPRQPGGSRMPGRPVVSSGRADCGYPSAADPDRSRSSGATDAVL